MTLDCCEHVLNKLEDVRPSRLTPVATTDRTTASMSQQDVDLIVVGVSCYPIRRLFVSQIRRVYPRVPMLILRRVESDQDLEDEIRGEFILSEKSNENADLEMIRSLRRVFPMQSCIHVQKSNHYDKVREVIRVIFEHYSNPHMDLSRVAREVSIPPAQLSRLLNREVGVSFRQLLKTTRIEEAKSLLASKKFSVKEVAARVGFSDSHYFSRSFKEMTGLSASEYQSQDAVSG